MIMIVTNARDKPGGSGPFCWQSIFIMRHLREVGESARSVSVPSILAVYVALTELATDHHEAKFRATVSEIAGKAGLGYRTTIAVLGLVADAGILDIQNNYIGDGAIKTSNTYTLLKHDPSFCKFCISHGEGRKARSLPNSLEDQSKDKREEGHPPSFLSENYEAWLMRAQNEFPERTDIASIAQKFFAHYQKKPSAGCYARLIEWVREERNPKIRPRTKARENGPSGWMEYLQKHYPVTDYPTRSIYETGGWADVPLELKTMIIAGLKQAG